MKARAYGRRGRRRRRFDGARHRARGSGSSAYRVWLWGTLLAATLAYLIFWGPSEVLLPFIVKNEMGGTARELGFVFAHRRRGRDVRRDLMSNRDTPPAEHHVHVRGLDRLDADGRGLRLGRLPVAAHGRELRLQRRSKPRG